MTTNAGSETSSAISGFSTSKEEQSADRTQRALSAFLRPEFLNRVDAVITFRRLDRENFVSIAAIQIEQLKKALAERGVTLRVTDAALHLIAENSYSEKYGARNMRRYIQKEIEDRLAQTIIERYESPVTQAIVNVAEGNIVIDCL